jgi:Ulp1 family protease
MYTAVSRVTSGSLPCQFEAAMASKDDKTEVIEALGMTLTKRDLKTLVENEQLNDQVRTFSSVVWSLSFHFFVIYFRKIINFYCKLIVDRAERGGSTYPKVHCFDPLFYTKLKNDGYKGVRKWTMAKRGRDRVSLRPDLLSPSYR